MSAFQTLPKQYVTVERFNVEIIQSRKEFETLIHERFATLQRALKDDLKTNVSSALSVGLQDYVTNDKLVDAVKSVD